jgi:CDP-paratose synthetase
MKQTVLVTGATGFLGSHLVKSLLKKDYQVIILKRSFSNTWRINDVLSQLICFDIDVCEIDQPFKEAEKIDAIIHTATCYGRHNDSISDVFTANTVFPVKLLETAASFKVNTFINTDTFYNKGIVPYKGLPNYSLSKYQFTEWGKLFASLDKIKFCNIRLEQIFGSLDDDTKFVTYLIKNCLSNIDTLNLTAGEQERDFIYVDDVVSAYLFLLEQLNQIPKKYAEYELGCGQSIPLREFVKTVHNLTHSRTQLNFGVLPYRDNEIMHSQANIEPLNKLGWFTQWKLQDALTETISGLSNFQ